MKIRVILILTRIFWRRLHEKAYKVADDIFMLIWYVVLPSSESAEIITVKGTAESITVKGSDTMVILGQRLAEEYMNKNKDVTIQVTGGGSGTGIAALLNKTTNLANSSRPIKDAEAKRQGKQGWR